MARLVGMSDLVTRVRRRAGREGDDTFSTGECKALISEQYGELYCAVAETGLRHFETEGSIAANGATSYTEPSDMLSFVGIDRVLDSAGRRVELAELMAKERIDVMGTTGDATAFQVVDDQIVLYPKPSTGTYKILYIPQPPDLSIAADTDQVDVVNPHGESFLLWGVAVKMLGPKTESDPQLAMAEREAARERLIDWAILRALHQPRRRVIADTPYDPTNPDPTRWRYPP